MGFDAGSGSLRVRAEATDQLIAATTSATAPARSMGASLRPTEWLTRTDTPPMPDQESQREPDCEPLGAQKNNLRKRHENGDSRQHDRGNSGRHALFGPEQQAVIQHKDANCENRSGCPFAAGRRRRTFQTHPREEHDSRNEETHACEKKGWNLTHTYTDGQEGRAPDEINDGERQHGLPCRRTKGCFHGK